MRKRGLAYCQHVGIAPELFNMRFIGDAPNFLEEIDVKALLAQIKRQGSGFDVIVIDTLAQVMPGEMDRETLLVILSTGLVGLTLEKFVIFNGHGRNGKSWLNELLAECLGRYFYRLPTDVLTNPLRQGNNPIEERLLRGVRGRITGQLCMSAVVACDRGVVRGHDRKHFPRGEVSHGERGRAADETAAVATFATAVSEESSLLEAVQERSGRTVRHKACLGNVVWSDGELGAANELKHLQSLHVQQHL
jgi:hypothetical protein